MGYDGLPCDFWWQTFLHLWGSDTALLNNVVCIGISDIEICNNSGSEPWEMQRILTSNIDPWWGFWHICVCIRIPMVPILPILGHDVSVSESLGCPSLLSLDMMFLCQNLYGAHPPYPGALCFCVNICMGPILPILGHNVSVSESLGCPSSLTWGIMFLCQNP